MNNGRRSHHPEDDYRAPNSGAPTPQKKPATTRVRGRETVESGKGDHEQKDVCGQGKADLFCKWEGTNPTTLRQKTESGTLHPRAHVCSVVIKRQKKMGGRSLVTLSGKKRATITQTRPQAIKHELGVVGVESLVTPARAGTKSRGLSRIIRKQKDSRPTVWPSSVEKSGRSTTSK